MPIISKPITPANGNQITSTIITIEDRSLGFVAVVGYLSRIGTTAGYDRMVASIYRYSIVQAVI